MRFNEDRDFSSYTIQSYQLGTIRIFCPAAPTLALSNEGESTDDNAENLAPGFESISSSCILTPKKLIKDWPPQQFNELQESHFNVFLELKPEVILLGTGQTLQFPDSGLTSPLLEAGIGVEVMDTAAACRTYNILMSEGRDVAAALMSI